MRPEEEEESLFFLLLFPLFPAVASRSPISEGGRREAFVGSWGRYKKEGGSQKQTAEETNNFRDLLLVYVNKGREKSAAGGGEVITG